MTTKTFAKPLNALEARYEAQKIAFAPVIFKCVHIAWKNGLLQTLQKETAGLTVGELAGLHGFSEYAVSVLLETCLSAGVVSLRDDRYVLEKIGLFILNDRLTQVNYDFIQDVCYHGLGDLEASLKTGSPAGLPYLGDWSSIYEGLSVLPEPARTSWFNFDHYYSDSAFPEVLPFVFSGKPRRLMDIGANTGKWALQCLKHDEDVHLSLVDLPIQLKQAKAKLAEAGHASRADLFPTDLLDESAAFPSGQDAVWMSQLLSCFSKEKIRSIFARAKQSLNPSGEVFVLDVFWDRQPHDIAAYCLINTSPYFTAMANGSSKMYQARDYIECAETVGLRLTDIRDGFGVCHSLLKFSV